MKNISMLLSGLFLLLLLTGSASASLITIGKAQFNGTGTEYNLIYDADSPFGPITWLDYTKGRAYWNDQKDWAGGLDSVLSVNLYTGYSVSWNDSSWRLPKTLRTDSSCSDEVNDPFGPNHSLGSNCTGGELGNLFYNVLGGNAGESITDTHNGNYDLFNNIQPDYYWTETKYKYTSNSAAWAFDFSNGYKIPMQYENPFTRRSLSGLAVHDGYVSIPVIPEPATMLLFGVGLLGLAGVSRRRSK